MDEAEYKKAVQISLGFYRRNKLGVEQILERDDQRRRKIEADGHTNPTSGGTVEPPMTDDLRAKFENALRMFTQVVRELEKCDP